MENLKIDENSRNVLGAITNDVAELIKNCRVNPITGRLLVDAAVTSTNTSIGSTIPGGTAGSILFLGAGSTLAQDNANLFYDDTNNFVGFGTNTPDSTLEIDGTFHYVDGNQTAGYILTSDASGNATWQAPGASVTGYNLIQNNGVSVTQRTIINLSTLLTATDSGGKTALTINVTNLAGDATFISTLTGNSTFQTDVANFLLADTVFLTALGNDTTFITALTTNTTFLSDLATSTTFIDDLIANTYFTTNLANDTNFISTLTSNVTFQGDIVSIINNAGGSLTIDLSTQVGTSILPLANGGTQTALTDPAANTIYVWDDTDNATVLATIGSGLLYDHSTHTLSSTGGSGGDVEKKVGVGGITDIMWFNIQLPFALNNPVTARPNVWDIQSSGQPVSPSYIGFNTSSVFAEISSDQDYLLPYFGGGVNGYRFDTPKQAIFSVVIYPSSGGGGGGVGFNAIGGHAITDAQGGNTIGAGFVRDGAGAWFARTGTGAAHTETAVTIADGAPHTLRCELDSANATPQVRFYIDGVLAATITTNIPSAGTVVGWAGGNATSGGSDAIRMLGCPSFAVEI